MLTSKSEQDDLQQRIDNITGIKRNLDLVTEIRKLATEEQTRYTTATPDQKHFIAQRIKELEEAAQKLAAPSPRTSWSRGAILGALAIVILGIVVSIFIVTYLLKAGFGVLGTIEGTRPIMVIAIVICTIIFGGSLLMGALFSAEGNFEERFRRAREIFLVFAGVFGTILGFYFGAGDTRDNQINVAAMLEDTAVVAYAVGGRQPYEVTVTYSPSQLTKTQTTSTGWATFTFNKDTDNIIPLTVSTVDSTGLRGSTTLALDAGQLRDDGWALPGAPTDEPTETATPSQEPEASPEASPSVPQEPPAASSEPAPSAP